MSHKMMFSREDAEEAKRYLSELLERLVALGLHIDVEELYWPAP